MKLKSILFVLLTGAVSACDSFLDVAPPTSRIPAALVFEDDDMATSALIGIYLDLYAPSANFAGGNDQSVTSLAGLSADELQHRRSEQPFLQFQANELNISNSYVQSLWASLYKSIYQANAVIEGLDAATTLTPSVKEQLTGEALFVRAFCYFYLVNLFGDVPLALTTNYKVNNQLSRSPVDDIYTQIKIDLSAAENILAEDYETSDKPTDRIRPNKFTATALLARVYLYTHDWPRAEDKATNIISRSDLYTLSSLNTVFLSTSKEAIWQLRPEDGLTCTHEGETFGPQGAGNVLQDDVMNAFEPTDARKAAWTTSSTSGTTTIYRPYKYKRNFSSVGETDEYSMVFRLAEQYLIRAEARAYQNKLTGPNSAESDINAIRSRTGLTGITVTTDTEALSAIEQERRIEFLVEWGHRWLDLKRWARADAVLSPVKPDWDSTDELYPVPAAEIRKNENLEPQNSGY